jgi:hypothetical protein
MKQVKMDYSMTITEWVDQLKATDVKIITVVMMVRNTIHMMLVTIQVFLQVPV